MNPSISSGRLAVLVALAILTPTPGICDDEDEVQVRHLSDASTDRTPAITAFPKYPSIARRDRIEGEAVVCFMVDVDGSIRRPSIRSSTHKIFEKPAMDAIRRSTFEPLARGETLSTSRTCRTYRFRLESVSPSSDSDS